LRSRLVGRGAKTSLQPALRFVIGFRFCCGKFVLGDDHRTGPRAPCHSIVGRALAGRAPR
jgi:hypothetical protein